MKFTTKNTKNTKYKNKIFLFGVPFEYLGELSKSAAVLVIFVFLVVKILLHKICAHLR